MWPDLGHVLAEVFPLAVGVALSPLPLIASVVVSLGERGGVRGAALLAGRFVGVVVVVGIFAALSEVFAGVGGPPAVLAAVRLLIGLALMVVGVVTWLRRPRGDAPPKAPAWMSALEHGSGVRTFAVGFTLSVANPKELAFGAGAGVVVGSSLTEWAPTLVAVVGFAVVGCITAALPVLAVAVGGERIRPSLDAVRTWLVSSSSTITAVVMLLFGAILVANAFL